jgi:hypothetical protein
MAKDIDGFWSSCSKMGRRVIAISREPVCGCDSEEWSYSMPVPKEDY